MTSFPASIKTFSTIVDLVDSVLAAHQNERGDEITALETYLRGDTNATVTTANVTAVENKIYNLTIAGLTANRNFTIPVASAAGQYLTMNIIDGDDTYYMVVIGAATVTINGNASATEWGRFRVKGDSVTLRSTSTTNWQIVAFNSNSITDGEVLTATGAGLAPAWEAAAGGGSSKIEGALINGKISVTVASNDLIVSLKTWAGADPSAGDPVKVYIAGNERSITSALSVTVADGANSFNAGSAELATKAIDYFAYLSWRAASSAVVIGFSRIPFARLYSDFSSTATNEKYGAFSTAPDSTDDVVNIGRFEATLSAGAGYTWTVPTFTGANLIQRPTFETRWLTWAPQWSCLAPMTINTPTISHAKYKVRSGNDVELDVVSTAFTITNASPLIYMTLPFSTSQSDFPLISGGVIITDAGGGDMGYLRADSTVTRAAWAKRTSGNYTAGAGTFLAAHGEYSI